MVLARGKESIEEVVIENNLALCVQGLIQFELKGRQKIPTN